MSGTEPHRGLALELVHVDRDDAGRTADARALNGRGADTARADHHRRVAAADLGTPGRRTVSGRNRARQQGGGHQRETAVDHDERIRRDDGVFGERPDLGHVPEVSPVDRVMAKGAVGRHAWCQGPRDPLSHRYSMPEAHQRHCPQTATKDVTT